MTFRTVIYLPWTEEPGSLQRMGREESDIMEQLSTHQTLKLKMFNIVKENSVYISHDDHV